MMKIGYGEDIHKLVDDRKLFLGGVEIPYEKGLLGHSDADVVIHALCDSILGALGLRDIGFYFRVDDPRWDNASSLLILREVNKMMVEKGYEIGNADISISCEKPHLNTYIPQMKQILAKELQINESCLAIKAMTNEGMDAVGEGKAIRAISVVLLKEKE